ncbi:MAG TPA: FliA/WhiG family RNA polymerase sigma factor [Candidatus Acidoferrum sp.]|nr:FliA/WhiG family RNA polymerase sigma factor [Candidatus Acidoferrum sp.]
MSKSTAHAHFTFGEKDERSRILHEQLPQVRYLARQIHQNLPRHVPLEDMVHAGVIGLIDAFNKFDRSKQVKFSSYAKFRIRGAILDSLREMDWGPRELRRKGRLVEEARHKLTLVLGRDPMEIEMAAELNLGLRIFQKLRTDLDKFAVVSVRPQSPEFENEIDMCECLPDKSGDTALFSCIRSEMTDLLSRAIVNLGERQRQVLALYYLEELTMKKVGILLGIRESRVCQIHSSALVHLRGRLDHLRSPTTLAAWAVRAGGH